MNSNAIKILLVEDNEDDYIIVRDVLRDALNSPKSDDAECFKLVWAETYQEGLKALQEWTPDAILLDYFLDVGTGLEWLKAARERGHLSPVILMTGQGDHAIDVQAMQAGVDDYIVKDQISGALLERTLRYAIERARTARALRESESRYRTLFETNPQPCWVYDRQTLGFLAVNQAAIEHYGYSRQEFSALTLRDIRPAEEVAPLLDHLVENLPNGPQERPWTHRKKDGSLIQVELSSSGLHFDGREARLVVVNDVTARHQAETALRQSEERLHLVTRATNDAIWDWDLQSNQIWRNQYFQTLFGCSPEDGAFEPTGWQSRIHPHDKERVMAGIHRLIDSGQQTWSDEYRLLCPSGEYAHVLDRGFVIHDETGHARRMIGSALDITARKEAEAAIRQSEERYRSLTEATSALVWNTPQLGVFVAPQPSWSAFTGQNWEAMQGRGWLEAVHPGDREETLREWALATEKRQACRTFHRLKRHDGSWFHMVVRAVPVLDGQGEVREWVGAHTDVNDRTLTEIALRQSEDRYRSLVHASSQIVWTVNVDGSQMISPSWMEFTGQSSVAMQNSGWLQAIHPEDRDTTQAVWQNAVARKEIYRAEYRLRSASGIYHTFATRAVPMLDGSGEIREWVGMTTDISARKSAEAERDRFFTVSLDLLCIAGADGFFKRLNPAFERVLGFSTEEIMAHNCLELVHPDDREMTARELAMRADGAHDVQVVNRYRCRDGSYRWFSWTAAWRDGVCYATARDVTDLREAQARWQRSLSLLQATLEATADGILVVDSAGQITDYNRKFLKLWGLDEVAGPDGVQDPDDQDAETQAAQSRHAFAHIRAQLSEPDNFLQPSQAPTVSDYQPLPLADGRVFACYSQPQTLGEETLGRVWSFRDISHRLQAAAIQEQLTAQVHQERQHLDDILANVPGQVWERYFDEAGGPEAGHKATPEAARRRNYVSSYVQTLLGYSPQEWLSSPTFWQDIMHPDDRENAERNRAAAAASGRNAVLQYRMIAKGGKAIWVESHAGPIRDESGRVIGLRGVTMDISARKQADQEQARLAMLLENTSDFVSWADTQGRVQYINPAGRAMIGIGPDDDVTSSSLYEMHPQWANHIIETQAMKQVRAGGVWAGESAILARDGREIPVSQVVMAPRDERGETLFFSTICRDVSLQKEVEAQLQRANDQLEARVARRTAELEGANHELSLAKEEADTANRAKSEFLSRMSHELRTPLNAILGFGQILEMRDLDTKDADCINQILKAGRHLLQLINEVLDIARIEAGRLSLATEPLEIDDVLQESLDLLMPLAAKRGIELHYPNLETGEKLLVLADRQRLHQVLLNLLSNAIKYNVEGGSVTFHCRIVQTKTLELQAFESDENLFERRLRIEVTDTGMGLSPEEQRLAFLPFERLSLGRTKVEGTGIGLALCQHLIQAMNGQIGVQSEVSQGSTFWIELPSVEPLALDQSPAPDPLQLDLVDLNSVDLDSTHLEPLQSEALAEALALESPLEAPLEACAEEAVPDTWSVTADESRSGEENGGASLAGAMAAAATAAAAIARDESGEGDASWLPPEVQQLIATIRPATVLYIEDNLSNLRLIENLFLQAPQLQLLTATRGDIGLERARVHRPDLILLDVHLPGIWGGEVMAQLQKSPQTRAIPVVVLSADGTPSQIEVLLASGARQYLIKPLGIEPLLQVVAQFLGTVAPSSALSDR